METQTLNWSRLTLPSAKWKKSRALLQPPACLSEHVSVYLWVFCVHVCILLMQIAMTSVHVCPRRIPLQQS